MNANMRIVAYLVFVALFAGCYGPPTAPKRECTRSFTQRIAFVDVRGDTTWTTSAITVRASCESLR